MKQKKKKKKKNIVLRIISIAFITIITLIFLSGVAFAGIAYAMVRTAPELDVNQILQLNEPSKLYYMTSDNKEVFMDEAPTKEKREIVTLNNVPKNLTNAIISIEDERFYKHNGYDPQRILGSFVIDIENKLKHSSKLQGASTLTQQLLKNTVLLKDSQSNENQIQRKVQEIYLASELEKELNKDQILEAYINTIPLGGNIYGVQKAANEYFGKDVKDLDLIQCAYLAGVTQNPSSYGAFTSYAKKNPSGYLDRTKNVLGKMKELGYIDATSYSKAMDDLNNKKLVFAQEKPAAEANKLNYEWFSRPVMDAVKTDLMAQYNYSSDEADKLISFGGLKIYTTMDKDLQDAAQKVLNEDPVFKGLEAQNNTKNKDPKAAVQPQAAAVVMDYHDGTVKAIIGGRGDQPAGSYNRAAGKNFLRPVGSTIKPLTVYGAAIDSKQATAATILENTPLDPAIGKQWADGSGKPYNPENYDGESAETHMSIRTGLKLSINIVAVKLEYQIGLKTGISYGQKFGLSLTKGDTQSIAAMSLGEIAGTNPLTMADAYGTFGNNGIRNSAVLYTKVVDKNGKVLLDNKTTSTKVMTPQSAYIMYDLLKGPTSSSGTGPKAKYGSMPVAGKTGTTSNKKDFWFCGLTPYYSGAVWIGNDSPKTYNYGVSSNTSAYLWGRIMEIAHKNLPVKDITAPDGITTAQVCADSGKVPTDACPNVITEMFVNGTVPTALCDLHIPKPVETPSTDNSNTTEQNNNTTNNTNNNNNNNTNTNTNTNTNNNNNNNNNNTNTTTPPLTKTNIINDIAKTVDALKNQHH